MSATKKGKAAQVEFENQTKEIRQLLSEQLKGYDARTEGKVLFLADLQEYCKKMSEVETEYSKNLDRLSDRFLDRLQKFKAQRKERSTTMDVWHKLLVETKNRAKQRQSFSDNLANNIANRFMSMSDDYQRISKKCREAGLILQDELCKTVHELQRKLRKYHTMFGESKTAESKLKSTEIALSKSEESGRKNEKMTKQKEKHQQRYSENKRKSVKAKNEYVLALKSTNSFLQYYYTNCLGDLVDGFDFNFHDSFERAIAAYTQAETNASAATIHSMNVVQEAKLTINPDLDKKYFFEDNLSIFAIPFKFQYLPYSEEESCQITPQQIDIVDFHCELFERLKQIKAETDEIHKTVEATADALKEMYKQWDLEMNKMANGETDMVTGVMNCQSIKNSSDDLEMYYVTKLREYIMTSSLKIRIAAENQTLVKTLGEVTEDTVGRRRATHRQMMVSANSAKTAKILESIQKKTKIFGCNLEQYLKITGREIPEVVESCVRFIKRFGLDHPGIFRLSGSSTDINDMKQLFECGRDPLAGLNHWKDINAVAGLLRVYFRELEDPLFPSSHYQQFIEASRFPTNEDVIRQVTCVINELPDSVNRVMKYLFKFLKQVSEHSEQNKMDAHNLAVVFGPTLLRIPSEQDMITYQSHVNGMMEVIIKNYDQVFPQNDFDTDGPRLSETEESDSEEDFEPRDAAALYDYSARSSKELSFKKGDIIRVFKRFNDDWWDGTLGDSDGFVPASYIKIQDPDSTEGDSMFSPQTDLSRSLSGGESHRAKDLNGPPRIPKREGSLKKRHDSANDRGSPVGPCPQPPIEEISAPPKTSTPVGIPFGIPGTPVGTPLGVSGFKPAISTDDIVNRQRSLRTRGRDDLSLDERSEGKGAETPRSTSLPRGASPHRSIEELDKVLEEEELRMALEAKLDNPKESPQRSQSLELDKSDDYPKPPIWQVREGTDTFPDPPLSPRSSVAPKVPPAVKPKPKGGRPNPPSRGESGSDLLASLHAAQAARGHRPGSIGSEKPSTEENRRDSRGSVADDTQL
ncbi:SLIT-ROBO Rho GTPase-activating protein 1 [Nematostella vectensis]|uniref:SLIT-ROBO Rho GTPase-activating protein 1 n=1 Tax=Nematostella vectensis TaxID=45351 RepID=UPI0013903452|nr:SLIT-ROBO Rho GTPase-activating protein 1 [Nematostella vectensis]